jgi:hypothetical protein
MRRSKRTVSSAAVNWSWNALAIAISNSADNSAACHTACTSRAAPARSPSPSNRRATASRPWRTGGLRTNKAAHRRRIAPLLPQPCFGAPAQQRNARPIGIGLDKVIVVVEPGGVIGIAQCGPGDEFLSRRIIDRCRKLRRVTSAAAPTGAPASRQRDRATVAAPVVEYRGCRL